MSAHYIYLTCPAEGCNAFESIYTGEIYTEHFPDSGPESFEGATIKTRCNEHIGETK